MEFSSSLSSEGDVIFTIRLQKGEIASFDNNRNEFFDFGKTDYCVSCRDSSGNERKYNIECYGDIAANIEAAVTCMKEMGNPSYGLSKGRCG